MTQRTEAEAEGMEMGMGGNGDSMEAKRRLGQVDL
jgi:hypothetical protein